MTDDTDNGGTENPARSHPPAATQEVSPTPPTTNEPTTEGPSPSEGTFVHPRLGVAQLRESWDPTTVPAPMLPPAKEDPGNA